MLLLTVVFDGLVLRKWITTEVFSFSLLFGTGTRQNEGLGS